ncbi:hypothetical protein BZG02_09970 [Labilibaculum filiforme]|uniref:Oxidoreductase n=1 Tax=Labilibaculum filiforme TaxID=1940526 RepID=A0A2N3HYF8_9BACT|nr:2Fe-2S iron-sulfur cluster-binding protein [Labilibaculum filiforme]PKQ63084.1 hypothetical protein BZG02_09970 [Labilibaculum filiforme]
MEQEFYRIPIVEIQKPIKEAITLSMQIPNELLPIFEFRPGQHLCFRFIIDGVQELRMYSLHNTPYKNGFYQVSVKIQKEGLISNYIANNLQVGDFVEVSVPQGDFLVNLDRNDSKIYYLFAAGSGITPFYCMLKSILLAAPKSKVFLLYGNRSVHEILFYDELIAWQAKFPNRLKIIQTLSKRFLDFTITPWEGKRGRIDVDMVKAFLHENPSPTENSEYYICGPDGMNQMVQDSLMEMGVAAEFIHFEYFSNPDKESDEGLTASGNAIVDASIEKENYSVQLAEGESVLEGLERVGAPVPYLCRSGICGTCKAHVMEGEVKMKASLALSPEDRKNKMILTCQAMAQTDKVKIEFK